MTVTLPDNWATLVGPVAVREFDNAADRYKPDLLAWAQNLPALPDDEFVTVAARSIYDSANVGRFRGNWDHEHFKATVCFTEANRRHVAAGHSEDCRGDNLYSRAYARALRNNGHRAPEAVPCQCGKG
ncbi:hypothetical protein [Micromonospora carbonacea]|uniref:hypothetical protein n=1 Tax=Micromonospora carbonacea TaxID=47853 RepID=UPI0037232816